MLRPLIHWLGFRNGASRRVLERKRPRTPLFGRLQVEGLEHRLLLSGDGGNYGLKFLAANPAHYLPMAASGTPAPIGFTNLDPIPGANGAPGPNYGIVVNGSVVRDAVTSLAPSSLALGQIIPTEMYLTTTAATKAGSTIQFTVGYSTYTTAGYHFGYDKTIGTNGIAAAFVDNSDPSTSANAKSPQVTVCKFTSTIANANTKTEEIQVTITVANLGPNENVVIELWTALDFPPLPPGLSGNVASRLIGAVSLQDGSAINSGAQTTDINKVSGFLSAPTANPDNYSTQENTTLTVTAPGVLSNDTDPSKLALTSFLSGTGTTTQGGSVTLNANGSFTYVPPMNFTGTDSFNYFARNTSNADSNITTVTITVSSGSLTVNEANNDQTAVEGASKDFTLGSFSSPAVGTFNVDVNWGDGTAHTTSTVTTTAPNITTYPDSLTHTYAEEGSYTITVTVTDPNQLSGSGTFNVTVSDPAVTPAGGFSFSAVEGVPSDSQTVATFTDPGGAEAPSDYLASIYWGDGSSSADTITVNNGTFSVAGDHKYAEEGVYTITVTISHDSAPTAQTTSTAIVNDADLTGSSAASFSGVQNVSGNLSGATFTDANTGSTTSDFFGTIYWGDGNTTNFTASDVSGSGGSYTVNGSHIYTSAGTFNISITVNDDGGSTTTITGMATVGVALMGSTTASANGNEGALLNLSGATFTDANSSAPASGFTAVINWGDGSPTSTGLVSGSGGNYSVAGSHTYADEGIYNISITVSGDGGTTTITGMANVAEVPLTIGKLTNISGLLPGDSVTLTRRFFDPVTTDGPWTVTINDGNGGMQTITPTSTQTFTFTLSYANPGTYTVTVTVSNNDGDDTAVKTFTVFVDTL